MSDNPIFSETENALGRPFPTNPPAVPRTPKYWTRRKKKARALTDRVWKEICEQWTKKA